MALKLAGRNPAKFVNDDGMSETTVTIQPDDSPEVVQAKLLRVLELDGYAAAPQPSPPAQAPQAPVFTPADRAATDARMEAASAAMGWTEDADFDNLPEK